MLGHRRLIVAAVVTLAAGGCGDGEERRDDSARAALSARCGRASDAVVSARGVGPIRLHAGLDEISSTCPVDPAAPGAPTPATARLEGRPVRLALAGGRVERITVEDPAFRTDRGVGVGSTLGALRAAYAPICAQRAGPALEVHVAGLDGLAFEVYSLPVAVDRPLELPADSLIDGVRIDRIHIGDFASPCARAARGSRWR